MATTISSMAVRLTASADGFNKSVIQAADNLARMDAQAKAATAGITSFAAAGVGVGAGLVAITAVTSAVSGLASASAGVAKHALTLAAAAEQNEISFRVMLQSGTAAKEMLGGLAKFAAATPFQLPELVNAAKMLTAFGVKAKDVQPTLTKLGDVAAGLSIPIGEIAEIFGKAKTAGTLFAEDINQLTGRGIPIIQQFAKQLGVSEGAIKKLACEGKITFAHLDRAFSDLTGSGGQFAGLMQAQSESLAGVWSSAMDAIDQRATAAGQSIIKALDLTASLKSTQAAAEILADSVEKKLGGAWDLSAIAGRNAGVTTIKALGGIADAAAAVLDGVNDLRYGMLSVSKGIGDAGSWLFDSKNASGQQNSLAKFFENDAAAAADQMADIRAAVVHRQNVAEMIAQAQRQLTAVQTAGDGGADFTLAPSRAATAIDAITTATGRLFDSMKSQASAAAAVVEQGLAKNLKVLNSDAQRIFESTRTPAEKQAAALERLNELLRVGALDADTYARAIAKAHEDAEAAAATAEFGGHDSPAKVAAFERRFTSGFREQGQSEQDKQIALLQSAVKELKGTRRAVEKMPPIKVRSM